MCNALKCCRSVSTSDYDTNAVRHTQTQRWGTADKKKKRPRQPSQEDASLEGGVVAGAGTATDGENASKMDQNGDMEVEVRFSERAVLMFTGSTL